MTGTAVSPSFDLEAAAAASLGQVHRATGARWRAGWPASCNIPTWPPRSRPISASCACCSRCAAAWARRSTPARSRVEIGARLARGTRLRARGQVGGALRPMLADRPEVRVPRVHPELSTKRLLTLQWLDGEKLLAFETAAPARRARGVAEISVRGVVAAVPALRSHPRRSASRQLFRGRQADGRGGQSLRFRLRAHFPDALRRGRRRALSGAEDADARASRTPMNSGVSRA